MEETLVIERKHLSKRDLSVMVIAAVFFFICLYWLFYGPSLEFLQNAQPIGQIEVEGTVRRRHSATLVWQNLSGSETIYHRDVVFVPADSKARAKLKEKVIELPPGIMVQFDETETDDFAITLIDLPRSLPLPKPLKVMKLSGFLPDTKPIELRFDELKARTVSKVFSEAPVQEIKRSNRNELEFGELEFYAVQLLSPLPDRYNLKTNRWVKMSWSSVPFSGVQYEVEVSKEPNFRRVLPHSTKKTNLQVQFDEEATFYWRVKASLEGREIASQPSSFTMVYRGGKHQVQIPIELPTDIPTGYPVEIARDKKFTDIVRSLVNNEPQCPAVALPAGTYYCRIREPQGPKTIKKYKYVVE